MSKTPIIITKKYLVKRFERCFKWVRINFLTNALLIEWGVDMKDFRKYKSFPPDLSAKIIEKLNSLQSLQK